MTPSRFVRPALPVFLATLLLSLAGCAPSLTPLYSDYDVQAPSGQLADDALRARIQTALDAAGWTLAAMPAPNAIATEAQTVSQWGLYKITARLEVVPFTGDHVRVFVHPYRAYVTGGRSKIPYLSSRLRRTILNDLNEAFAAQGLVVLGTPEERDEAETEDVAAHD